jgi:hypothetical protein
MSHVRAITVHLSSNAAATLTQAARGNEESPRTLSEFCGEALEQLAKKIEWYLRARLYLVDHDGDLPDDLPGLLKALRVMTIEGIQLAGYCDGSWLRVRETIDRLKQIEILAETPIEVPVLVEWDENEDEP